MSGILNFFKNNMRAIADFFVPRRCLMCGKVNPRGEFDYICPHCAQNLIFIRGARCLVCSEIIGGSDLPDVVGCPACSENPPHFDRSAVVCSFTGTAREIIHELKYRDGAHLVSDISKILKKADKLSDFTKNSTLVPVPLHCSRTLKRRFNQSELIARAAMLAFPLNGMKIANLLYRTRPTSTQTTLNKIARAENVHDAFAFADSKANRLADKSARIVIVDDVMMSGATLSECAGALKSAGFKDVSAFAFARRL